MVQKFLYPIVPVKIFHNFRNSNGAARGQFDNHHPSYSYSYTNIHCARVNINMTWWTDNLLSVVFRIPPTHPGLTVVPLPASKWGQGNVSSGLGTGQETVLTKMILCLCFVGQHHLY